MRREQHLNSMFQIRKKRLTSISRENKKIYLRINCQNSAYRPKQRRTGERPPLSM
jgi:hypothetical protein